MHYTIKQFKLREAQSLTMMANYCMGVKSPIQIPGVAIQGVEIAKPEMKDFSSSRKSELDGKRWSEGGYAYGYDYNYARSLDTSLKQIRFAHMEIFCFNGLELLIVNRNVWVRSIDAQ